MAIRVLVVDALVGNDYSMCLGRGLTKTNVEVELVTVGERQAPFEITFPLRKWAPSKKASGSKIRKLGDYFKYLIRLYKHLKQTSSQIQTVAHFQFFRLERVETFYLLFLRLAGIRLVYTAHNILPHESSKIDRFLKYIVYKSSHGIIVHSAFIKDALLKAFNVDPNKIHVVPHGNFDHYLPETSLSNQEARDELGLAEEDIVLLFFGYIRAYKGLDMLLEAFDIAASKNKRLKLVIAGMPHTAELEKSTKAFIENSAAKDRILFHGRFIPHEEIKHFFVSADLVVLPYKHIYHSGIIHLAYSYGKAVLATNVGDFSETIVQEKSGYIVPENTVESFADHLLKLAENEELLPDMGEYARNLSSSKYSWTDIGKQTEAVYKSVLGS
ncbi:MAG: glycosyltransferase family 4 protein [Rhodothermaceae bacterium]|nr:glycosyltransferase family 4 protein [Rhodothermaceae bacterium]